MTIIFLLLGVALLYLGAELLVQGASQLALSWGVSSLVVGLTVVSFATSSPEAVASLMAQLSAGSGEMALGNVVGSNIANMGLILGCTCLISPITFCSKMQLREMPIMLVATLLLSLFFFRGTMGQLEGLFLLALLLLYVAFHVWQSHRLAELRHEKAGRSKVSRAWDLTLVGAGTVLLVAGGYCLVTGSVSLMAYLGVSERVIGLTVIALGTSLPELAASVVAALRGESDIAIGNVVGSNIFNLLLIVGLIAVIAPVTAGAEFLQRDVPVMLGLSLFLWVMMWGTKRLGRRKGALLLLAYCSYIYSLF